MPRRDETLLLTPYAPPASEESAPGNARRV